MNQHGKYLEALSKRLAVGLWEGCQFKTLREENVAMTEWEICCWPLQFTARSSKRSVCVLRLWTALIKDVLEYSWKSLPRLRVYYIYATPRLHVVMNCRKQASTTRTTACFHHTYNTSNSCFKTTCSLSSPTAAGSYLQTKLSLPPSRAPPCPSAMTKHSSASAAICV